MIYKLLITLYLIYVLIVVVHEFCHVFIAKVLCINIERVEIGNYFYLRIHKLFISPIILSGYVEVDLDELLKKSNVQIVMFFLSGIVGNLLMIIFTFLFVGNYILFLWSMIVNILSIIISIIPIVGENDFMLLVKCLSEKIVFDSLEI